MLILKLLEAYIENCSWIINTVVRRMMVDPIARMNHACFNMWLSNTSISSCLTTFTMIDEFEQISISIFTSVSSLVKKIQLWKRIRDNNMLHMICWLLHMIYRAPRWIMRQNYLAIAFICFRILTLQIKRTWCNDAINFPRRLASDW